MKTEQATTMKTTDKVSNFAHDAVDTITDTTNHAADRVSHFAHDTVDTINNATSRAAEAFDEKSEKLINAEQKLVKECRSYIQDNPVTSLGIAVAAGFLLSRLLSSR